MSWGPRYDGAFTELEKLDITSMTPQAWSKTRTAFFKKGRIHRGRDAYGEKIDRERAPGPVYIIDEGKEAIEPYYGGTRFAKSDRFETPGVRMLSKKHVDHTCKLREGPDAMYRIKGDFDKIAKPLPERPVDHNLLYVQGNLIKMEDGSIYERKKTSCSASMRSRPSVNLHLGHASKAYRVNSEIPEAYRTPLPSSDHLADHPRRSRVRPPSAHTTKSKLSKTSVAQRWDCSGSLKKRARPGSAPASRSRSGSQGKRESSAPAHRFFNPAFPYANANTNPHR